MLPLVSILMPNYNKSPFLHGTLHSLLKQSYVHWECIVVDDHSSDSSLDILNEFASTDSRIKVYRRPDSLIKGANSCRNFAFSVCSGEYIQYLDSDDQLSENKIKRQVIQATNVKNNDVFVSNWAVTKIGIKAEPECLNRFDDFPSHPVDLLLKGWSERTFIPCFSYLVPRELIKRSGGWDEKLVKNQDGEFFCRILVNANKIYYDNEGYGIYVQSPGSGHIGEDNSLEAITSKWNSFLSYEKVMKTKRFDDSVRTALVYNFQHIFLQALRLAPSISREALVKIRVLDNGLKIKYLFFMRVFLIFGFDIGYRLYKFRMKLF
jgi:glycosyltransferase involved in cell wall biosynthesis